MPNHRSESEVRSAAAISEVDALARERVGIPLSHAESLLRRVTGPKPADIDSGDWEHEVNSTLNALRAQEEMPSGFTDTLVDMAQIHADPVLRLYALQHLSFLHERENADGKARITNLFTTLAADDAGPMAGTAILMLSDLQRAGASLDAAAIDTRAMALATSPQARHDVRVSAIHACVDRQIAAFLPEARRIAFDTTLPTVVRKAAIHAVGRMGDATDIALLEPLGKTITLAPALTPALASLESRRN